MVLSPAVYRQWMQCGKPKEVYRLLSFLNSLTNIALIIIFFVCNRSSIQDWCPPAVDSISPLLDLCLQFSSLPTIIYRRFKFQPRKKKKKTLPQTEKRTHT